MKLDRVVTLTFSPNGTTRQVADAIAQGAGLPQRLDLDRTAFDSRWTGADLRPGDLAVIALPVYYGRLPKLMVEFFRYVKAEGIPAVLVVTYGNRAYDDALLELKNESLEHGFVPVAAGAFAAHHCMATALAQGRPGPGAGGKGRRPGGRAGQPGGPGSGRQGQLPLHPRLRPARGPGDRPGQVHPVRPVPGKLPRPGHRSPGSRRDRRLAVPVLRPVHP